MTASVAPPALTMMIAVRGFCSVAANSSYDRGRHESGLGVVGHELVGLVVAPVEDRDRVALAAREVAGEVGAHHRQTHDADVGDAARRARARGRGDRAGDVLGARCALVQTEPSPALPHGRSRCSSGLTGSARTPARRSIQGGLGPRLEFRGRRRCRAVSPCGTPSGPSTRTRRPRRRSRRARSGAMMPRSRFETSWLSIAWESSGTAAEGAFLIVAGPLVDSIIELRRGMPRTGLHGRVAASVIDAVMQAHGFPHALAFESKPDPTDPGPAPLRARDHGLRARKENNMSTETDTKVHAELRENFGKGFARRLRAAGKIPAVIYGHGTEPVHVALPGPPGRAAHPSRQRRARARRQRQAAAHAGQGRPEGPRAPDHRAHRPPRREEGREDPGRRPDRRHRRVRSRHDRQPRQRRASRSRSRPPTSPSTSRSTSRASRTARTSPRPTSRSPRARRSSSTPRLLDRRRSRSPSAALAAEEEIAEADAAVAAEQSEESEQRPPSKTRHEDAAPRRSPAGRGIHRLCGAV